MSNLDVLNAIQTDFNNLLKKVNGVTEIKRFYRMSWLNPTEIAVIPMNPENSNSGYYHFEDAPYFSIKFNYRKNKLDYSVISKTLTISRNTQIDPDKYNYEILKLIGYITKSLFQETGFYLLLDDILSQHTNYIACKGINAKSFQDNFKRLATNHPTDFMLFKRPAFVIYKHISYENYTIVKIGDIDREGSTKTLRYSLSKSNSKNIINNEEKILSFLKNYHEYQIPGYYSEQNSPYYGVCTEYGKDNGFLDIGLTRALLSYKEDLKIDKLITPPVLSTNKIYMLVFLMFCDIKALDSFFDKGIDIYHKYLILSLLNSPLYSSHEFAFFDLKVELPWEINNDFFEFLKGEIFKIFDKHNFLKRIDNFSINNNLRIRNKDFFHLLYNYLNSELKAQIISKK